MPVRILIVHAAMENVFLHAQMNAQLQEQSNALEAAIKHAEIMILILVMNGVLQQIALLDTHAAVEHVFALTNAQLQEQSNVQEVDIKHAGAMTAILAMNGVL